MAQEQGLGKVVVDKWREDFPKDDARVVAQQACTQFDTLTLLSKKDPNLSHCFNTKVSVEVKPVTDQKSSGRCWIYACFNVLRTNFCKAYKIEEFEFSQTHTFFWDKVERCNYMLRAFIKLAQEGADHTDRTLNHLLTLPTNDGGQWQMLVNLIEKYGIVPNSQWSSPYLAQNSRRLGAILNNQLRAHCATIMSMVKEGKSQEELEQTRHAMMTSLFNVISTCLGSPPDNVEFDYYDKDKVYHKIGPMSPLHFYKTIIKPLCDLEKQVVLTHDPRHTSEYRKTYTVAYLNNMDNCKPVVYLNLPIEELKKYAKLSIQADQPVWFGCDVGKELFMKEGTLSTDQFNYGKVLGINVRSADKATRLLYKETEMTHAMVLTAANVEESGVVSKWRVENSWGENSGNKGKGFLVMDDGWFDEYVFLVVVDQSLLSEDLLKCLDQAPIVLPAWDPMGALARS